MPPTPRASRPAVSRKPAAETGSIKPADFVSALARGIEVLTLFSADRPSLTTSEVADLTGVSRAAARRTLLTLRELGYLDARDDSFRPRPRLLDLGYAYLSSWNLRETVEPLLADVVEALRENCSLGILDGTDVIYLARAEARRIVQSIAISIGTRVPARVSAMGRVLLAGLPEAELDALLRTHPLARLAPLNVNDPTLFHERLERIRAQGYAMVDGEFEEGLISVAAPVHDAQGRVVAAINVGAPKSRADAEAMQRHYLPVLQAKAAEISRTIAMRAGHFATELSPRIELP